ncbi:MAG: hypothetical protein DVB26_01800 [Verrucomicrobia bacterium]|nr:MAG: hypothetical protein DVB26_01800 [Verrucomicrobiota bacterium]
MPPSASEPEKYSIDAMMERLKGQSAEPPPAAGELVTRADGSQALRVRKHKRRSEQPKRDEAKRIKRFRTLQVASGLVLLLLIALGIGTAYVYANSAPYHKSITATIANSTGASVDLRQFRVSPASANAESLALEWPAGSFLKAMRLNGVSADISPLSIFGGRLRGDEVCARDGSLWLLPAVAATAGPTASPFPDKSLVHFSRISVPKFNIYLGDTALPEFKVLATEGSLRLDSATEQTTLHLYRGNLQLAGWPVFKIDRAVMEFRAAETELVILRVTDSQPKRGILDLSGRLQPWGSQSPSIFSVKLDNFDFGELLGPEFGDLITAKLDTRSDAAPSSLRLLLGSPTAAELNLAFKSTVASKVSIRNFPFLLSLMRTLNDKWYENPTFVGDFTGLIHRQNASVELRELQLESKSRMAIHAQLTSAADKSLTGSMEVGIPESIAQLAHNPKINSMLSQPRDGYRWLTLKLGGSLAHPSDNFAALYAAAEESAVEADEPSLKDAP